MNERERTAKVYGSKHASIQSIKDQETSRIKSELLKNELTCATTPMNVPFDPLVSFPIDESIIHRLTDLSTFKERNLRHKINLRKAAEKKKAMLDAIKRFRHLINEHQLGR